MVPSTLGVVVAKPLVSIGMAVWNGEAYLAKAIESILAQTYENIELIILDNLSTDGTSAICASFARRDSRLRYVLDSEPRDVSQAFAKIVQFVLGEFFMTVCDDDEYEPAYIERLVDLLLKDAGVGLAYSGWGLINPDGSKVPQPRWQPLFKAANSRVYNFARYLFFREPIPICFGVLRTQLHRAALAYYVRPDRLGWNHDNLYILRLLSMARVDYCPDNLFYYRLRDRVVLYKLRGQYSEPEGTLKPYLSLVRHQIAVRQVISAIICESSFSRIQRELLRVLNQLAVLSYIARPLAHPRNLYRKVRDALGD
jgi:glycosyltransferase involved in cell wall biosynthesis